MKKANSKFQRLVSFIFATDSDIQVIAFNILAVCGITVSAITAVVNGFRGSGAVIPDIAGALVSIALMYYCHKSGNYKGAMTLTAFLMITTLRPSVLQTKIRNRLVFLKKIQ